MYRRIFLAGAAGAIGRRLCLLLVADGWTVTGTTRSGEKADQLRALGVEPAMLDIFDEAAVTAAVARARPDVVIHQLTDLPAGLDPAKMAEASARNARIREIGTRNLVAAAAAAGVGRLIAQSIAFAYKPGPVPYREQDPLNLSATDRAGISARGVASLELQVLGAPLTGIVLRYGRIYGPGTGFDGPQPGPTLHVDAAADAARLALTRGAAGIYNVAEADGTVLSRKAETELGWRSDFRIG
jgi:nucleoside-diphosphate-sugar epimerase